MAHSTLKYQGITPGANGNTTILFTTTLSGSTDVQNAQLPECYFALSGTRKFSLDLKHNQAGTLNAYKSNDRGATWRQVKTEAIAAPAATDGTLREWLVEGVRDFKLEWVNGGSAQNPWVVDMSLSDQRTIS